MRMLLIIEKQVISVIAIENVENIFILNEMFYISFIYILFFVYFYHIIVSFLFYFQIIIKTLIWNLIILNRYSQDMKNTGS